MSTSKGAIRFSTWVPPDAQKEFDDLYSILTLREARYMLQRLATRPTMEGAWAELKHFKNVTPDILVTWTFMAWISTMRVEKGHGYAPPPLGTDPAPNSSPLPHELAPHARAVANYLRAVDPTIRAENGITETTLKELDGVSAFIEREAGHVYKLVSIAPLPRKARARNAHHVTFVNCMCNWLSQPKGRRPYSLVAILVNVAFNVAESEEWDADRVKHCYRSRSDNK